MGTLHATDPAERHAPHATTARHRRSGRRVAAQVMAVWLTAPCGRAADARLHHAGRNPECRGAWSGSEPAGPRKGAPAERARLPGIRWADADAGRVVTEGHSGLICSPRGATRELEPLNPDQHPDLAALVRVSTSKASERMEHLRVPRCSWFTPA